MPNVGGMLGDIKAKLGFGGNSAAQQDDDTYEEYDEYADYGDYGEDDYDDYNSRGYGNRNRVTTRDVGSSLPRLVSYDDARASTRFTESSSSSRYSRSSGSFGRTMVDSSLPPSMTPEGSAQVSAAASKKREGGLDSLFSPTASSSQALDSEREESSRLLNSLPVIGAAASGASGGSSSGQYDPYEAYNGSGSSSYSMQRRVTVLRPTSYGDVENVAKTLKAGDAVVLVLSSTRDDLSKRILDFSFGVASALDASVDCISDKVFAITRGAALSSTERANLHL